jgi:hypothetical protein
MREDTQTDGQTDGYTEREKGNLISLLMFLKIRKVG